MFQCAANVSPQRHRRQNCDMCIPIHSVFGIMSYTPEVEYLASKKWLEDYLLSFWDGKISGANCYNFQGVELILVRPQPFQDNL